MFFKKVIAGCGTYDSVLGRRDSRLILDMRIVESDREYKVKWHAYGRRDTTWEPESQLLQYGATASVAKYEAKLTAAGNKKLTKGIAKKGSVRTASIFNL